MLDRRSNELSQSALGKPAFRILRTAGPVPSLMVHTPAAISDLSRSRLKASGLRTQDSGPKTVRDTREAQSSTASKLATENDWMRSKGEIRRRCVVQPLHSLHFSASIHQLQLSAQSCENVTQKIHFLSARMQHRQLLS